MKSNTMKSMLLMCTLMIIQGVEAQTHLDLSSRNYLFRLTYLQSGHFYQSVLTYGKRGEEPNRLVAFIGTDTAAPDYRLRIGALLEEMAAQLLRQTSQELLEEAISAIENYQREKETESIRDDEYLNHLFYHYAILKISQRLQHQSSGRCTVYPGYMVGKAAFVCEEDLLISVADFLGYAKANQQRLLSIEGGEQLMKILEQTTAKEISLSALRSQLKSAMPICMFIDGSSCGCCGNYNGVCMFCSLLCFFHDYACWKSSCYPRYLCFKGCQTTPCK